MLMTARWRSAESNFNLRARRSADFRFRMRHRGVASVYGRDACGNNGVCVLRHDVELGDDRFPQEGGNVEIDLCDDGFFRDE